MTFFMQWTLSLFSCSFDKSVVRGGGEIKVIKI